MAELTATAVRNTKPRKKRYKLGAGGGLYLEVTPTGSKLWRFKYRLDGKEKLLSLGAYPDVPLKRAREKRDELRRLLADGTDPGQQRRAEKAARLKAAANSFEAVAREWYDIKANGGKQANGERAKTWAPAHAAKTKIRLERHLLPYLGRRPIADITAPELLDVLRRIESRGTLETAHRVKQIAGQVFRYAVATRRIDSDPSRDLSDALISVEAKHMAAPEKPEEVGPLLRAIWDYDASPVVRAALRLHPYVFVRPGELRQAEWREMDLDTATWEIPAEKTKMKRPLIVPLSVQAVAVLRELEPLTGRGRHVFPSARGDSRPMSNATENAALRRQGIGRDELVAHGWRAVARTLLDEQLGFRADYIEQQLGHRVRDPLGRAYNRTKHLPERRAMMQAWADYLDSLKAGGNVVALHRKAVAS